MSGETDRAVVEAGVSIAPRGTPDVMDTTTAATCPVCRNPQTASPVLRLPWGYRSTVCTQPAWHRCQVNACTRPFGHAWWKRHRSR